jgi:dUTP pyrophosphatase
MSQLTLYIKPVNEAFADVYKTAADTYNRTPLHERNSGMDLFCDAADIDTTYSGHAMLVGQGCHAAAFDDHGRPRAFWLAPRSSISRTPYRLANSLGLIDAGYRGVIKAALSLTPDLIHPVHALRLTQIATPDLLPWHTVIVVDKLPGSATERGAAGFGSTGSGASIDHTYFS